VVELTSEPSGDFEAVDAFSERLEVSRLLDSKLLVFLGDSQLVRNLQVLDVRDDRLIRLDLGAQLLCLGHDGLRSRLVVPKARLRGLGLEGGNLIAFRF
jgi:hypothetical protein